MLNAVVVIIVIIRDVNETRESRVSIFFLIPGKEISQLPRIETDATARQQAYCEREG